MNERVKKITSLLFLFFTLNVLYPDETGTFGISSGDINLGYRTDIESGYIYGHVINIMYQFNNGLGLSISPVFYSGTYDNSSFNPLLTFVNINLFYDIFKPFNNEIDNDFTFTLQPFVSINMVSYNDPYFFELHSGLRFSIRKFLGIIFFESFIIETGYIYNSFNKHGFYISLGIDLIVWSYATGQSKIKDVEENPEKYPDLRGRN
jgi:hypothetical protein